MTTVSEVFLGKKSKKGDIGIEIEVEGSRLPFTDRLAEFWRFERDGSLRGESAEYVLHSPVNRQGANSAINLMVEEFTRNGTVINDSMRAGVHFHVNVGSLTVKELFTFVSCYYILEDVICESAGESRQGNLFTLRLTDAYEPVFRISSMLKSKNPATFRNDDLRYASLNLTALNKYGSVEFRMLRTPTNLRSIIPWVDLFLTLRDNSIKLYNDPASVVYQFSGGGEEEFARGVLGDELFQAFVANVDNYRYLMRRGCRNVQDYAFDITDPDEWNNFKPKTSRTLDELTIRLTPQPVEITEEEEDF